MGLYHVACVETPLSFKKRRAQVGVKYFSTRQMHCSNQGGKGNDPDGIDPNIYTNVYLGMILCYYDKRYIYFNAFLNL